MPRTYRIAMVGACPFPTSQGSQVLIRQLSEALADRGHQVHIVAYHLGEDTLKLPSTIRIHRTLPLPGYRKIGSGPAWGKLILDPLLLLRLTQVVRREKIEVIHAHNYEALLAGWLVGRVTGCPVVYHSHNVMAAELPTYFNSPWAKHLAAWLANLLDRQLPRRADMSIALSSEAIPFFRQFGVREERIRLIPPGIDLAQTPAVDATAVRRQYRLDDRPIVIYTGNLDQYQRLEQLIRAFQQIRVVKPEAELLIVSHNLESSYQTLLEKVGVHQGVRFIHSHSFVETHELLVAADVAICPRVACFGFPIKLLNYMAAGKAVVVAQGSAKGIRHLENGYVAADDETSLADGIIHLLQNPDLAGRLGLAARATVEARFQWSHIVWEIERCYDQLTRHIIEPVLINEQLF